MASEPRLRILQLLAAPKVNFSEQWSADPAKLGGCMTLISDALAVPNQLRAGNRRLSCLA